MQCDCKPCTARLAVSLHCSSRLALSVCMQPFEMHAVRAMRVLEAKASTQISTCTKYAQHAYACTLTQLQATSTHCCRPCSCMIGTWLPQHTQQVSHLSVQSWWCAATRAGASAGSSRSYGSSRCECVYVCAFTCMHSCLPVSMD